MRCRGSAPPQVDQVPGGQQSTSRSLHQKSTAHRGCWKWSGVRTFFRDPSLMSLKRSELRQSGFENDCWMWFCVARSHAQLSKVPPKDVTETMTAKSTRWRGAEELAGCETKCELSEVSELSQPSHTKCSRCNFCYKARLEAIAKDKYLRNFLPYQILRGPPSQRLSDTHFYDGEKAFPECNKTK